MKNSSAYRPPGVSRDVREFTADTGCDGGNEQAVSMKCRGVVADWGQAPALEVEHAQGGRADVDGVEVAVCRRPRAWGLGVDGRAEEPGHGVVKECLVDA